MKHFLFLSSTHPGLLVRSVTDYFPPSTPGEFLAEPSGPSGLPSLAGSERGCFLPVDGTPMPTSFRLLVLSLSAEPSPNNLSAPASVGAGQLLFLHLNVKSLVCHNDLYIKNDCCT